ncbi:SNF1-like_3 [Blepharisma stoltei]|uniref:Protein kinase domain-containing protein n=1 Tax=Blepharisma stoltei TaxID=1481888 RepID=A0AAU9IJB5_9CILI|nr:unnamed protein product [Blepharisma stoltei]
MSAIDNYRILGHLGHGTYGQVKLAEHLSSSTNVAIKVLKKRAILEKNMVSKVKREIQVLKLFHHPHIIRLYEVIETPKSLVLVLEYLPGGELYNLIDRYGKLHEEQARNYIQQILSGLAYCHSHRVAHRDIKPENLLLDIHGNVKIADFGLANLMPDGNFLKTSCGTPNYVAPEVISGYRYCGPEADVWSTGVVLFALLAGSLPFDDVSIPALFTKIKSGNFVMPYHFSEPVKDLIMRMLNPDPIARITIQQIQSHPWLTHKVPKHLSSNVYIKRKYKISEPLIDEEILQQALVLTRKQGMDKKFARDRILKRKSDSIVVCYEILLDQKLSGSTSKYNITANHTPLFKQEPCEVSTAELSTIASSRCDSSEIVPAVEDPNNWAFGIKSTLAPSQFLLNLQLALRDAGLEWKSTSAFSLNVKSVDARKDLKMRADIYRHEGSFVVDFKLRNGVVMIFLDVIQQVYSQLKGLACK